MSKVFKGCGCQTLGVGPLGNKDCCAPALVEALEAMLCVQKDGMRMDTAAVFAKAKAALAAAYGEKS
jgi:hypothetical protein